ncbi:MAG: hypothetical protein U5K33_05310 [Halofilum sp. (in: g-proteobacteria)]|nr:hypothetical protein [Halofilum sp. (in: g-proteobacteria)]
MRNRINARTLAGMLCCTLASASALAHENDTGTVAVTGNTATVPADSHAPIGVMGDHMHSKGEWMFSYRFMRMDMQGNRDGTDDLSPEEIVTSAANPSAPPPNLRVVPTEMTMEMHMFGAMYAPSDDLTLMAMLPYLDNEMDHVTFQGMAGTNRLGTFTTKSSGIGDAKLTGLFRLHTDEVHHVQAIAGVSLPTGSITETDDVLSPMNTRPELRLPYPMQLGSGTLDLIGGVSYLAGHGPWGWGAQYRAVLRTGENDEDYTLGDIHRLTAWLSRRWQAALSGSLRLEYRRRGNIDGADRQITAPVQTADPDRQGGEWLELYVGVNWAGQGDWAGHRLALEYGTPLEQDLDGPQLEIDSTLILGYQHSW